ncbi:5-formyltetrahydrofolate cyclo-ligase [Frigidibacter sp. ROC022]|uniref:5-formyltetrahydrofolate cyclo-ligase n=1 Tax=Frigidibacter sp. ROC022 TaxID=2971796 RepID=UPI00215A6ABC|nr:5-formyltetrahydrofolate cyclo-ligase [Frigidibacter sp. ROC022]MCR8726752.1 5-formyltetrahydrofolate cyclo-ligase [Frigidibacter sp. ROC022]
MTVPHAKELKAAARIEALMQRDAAHRSLDADDRSMATRHLLSSLARWHGRVVAGYLPIRTEIDPLPAMTQLAAEGDVAVPVMTGAGRPLEFRRWTPGCALVDGGMGTLIPESGETLVPDALIVPVVAFDALGHRLGYGGGFYDRTLTELRARQSVFAVGFAYAAQEMAALPVETTDARLDAVVTEEGFAVGG